MDCLSITFGSLKIEHIPTGLEMTFHIQTAEHIFSKISFYLTYSVKLLPVHARLEPKIRTKVNIL
jgi:hypothetical protein